MKRAVRRHHRQRLKKSRARYWGDHAGQSVKKLGMVVSTPRLCSCWLCGNTRKYHGLTLQERRAYL